MMKSWETCYTRLCSKSVSALEYSFSNSARLFGSANKTEFVANEPLSHQTNAVSNVSNSYNPYNPNDLLGVSYLYELNNSNKKTHKSICGTNNSSDNKSITNTATGEHLSTSSTVDVFNSFANQSYSAALSSTLRSWNKLDYWCNLCVEPFNSWNEHVGKKEHVIFEHLYELLINLERRWDVAEVCSELINWEKKLTNFKNNYLETISSKADVNSSDSVSDARWGNSYPRPWHTVEHDVMLQRLSSMQKISGSTNRQLNKVTSNRALKKLSRKRNATFLNKQTINSIIDSLRDMNYPINHVLNYYFQLYEESALERRYYEVHACLRYLLDEKVIDINQKNFSHLMEEGSNVLHRRIFPMFAQIFPRAEAKELTAIVQNNLSTFACAVVFYQCHLEVFITPEMRDVLDSNRKSNNVLRNNNKHNSKKSTLPLSASRTTPRRLISINSGAGDNVRGFVAQANEVGTTNNTNSTNNDNTFDSGEDDMDDDELSNANNNEQELFSEGEDEDNTTLSSDIFEYGGGQNSSTGSLSFWLRSSFVRVLLGAIRWAVDDDCYSREISSADNVAVDSHYYTVASHLAHLILSEFTHLKSAEYVTRVQKVINRPEGLREMQTTRNSNNSVLGRAANRLHRVSFQGKTSSSPSSSVVNTTFTNRHEVVPALSNWGIRQWVGSEAFFNASFGKLLETRGLHRLNGSSAYGISGSVHNNNNNNVNNNKNNDNSAEHVQQINQSNRRLSATRTSSNDNFKKSLTERNVRARVAQFTTVPANEWPRRNMRTKTW